MTETLRLARKFHSAVKTIQDEFTLRQGWSRLHGLALAAKERFRPGEEPGEFESVNLCVNFDQCNLKCIMCWTTYDRAGNVSRPGLREMPASALSAVLADPRLDHTILSVVGGGEPFLYSEMDLLLKEGTRNGRRLMIMTNGTLLKRSALLWELAKTEAITLTFSLDAATEDTYAQIRPPGKWKTVMENVERFAELAKVNPKLKLQSSFVVLRQNLQELMPYMRLNAQWKSAYTHLHPAMNAGFPAEWRVDVASPEYRAIMTEVVEFARANDIYLDPLPELFPAGAADGLGPEIADARTTCQLPFKAMTISHEGDVYLCDTAFRERYVAGNVLESGIKGAWNSANWRSVRVAHLAGRQAKHPLCSKCLLVGACH